MSRSYKKNPFYTDGGAGIPKFFKRLANKKVRKYHKKIANGNAFKKINCSYDIHDFICYWSWKDALHQYYKDNCYNRFSSEQELYNFWSKYHKRK